MAGRKPIEYSLYVNGIATGVSLTSKQIEDQFGLDKRNINKYSTLGGGIYRKTFNFIPVEPVRNDEDEYGLDGAHCISHSSLTYYRVFYAKYAPGYVLHATYGSVLVHCSSADMARKMFEKEYDQNLYHVYEVLADEKVGADKRRFAASYGM